MSVAIHRLLQRSKMLETFNSTKMYILFKSDEIIIKKTNMRIENYLTRLYLHYYAFCCELCVKMSRSHINMLQLCLNC